MDPDNLAVLTRIERYEANAELLGAVRFEAYEQTFGRQLPPIGASDPGKPVGKRWETEKDLKALLPRLYERYYLA